MARLPDPAQRPTLDLAALVKLGACDIRTWAIEFDPPPGPRGIQPGMKPKTWKCTILSQDAARPMIIAIRDNPADAEVAAKSLFADMMRKRPGEPVEAISDPRPTPAKAKPGKVTPVSADELDDDAAGLI